MSDENFVNEIKDKIYNEELEINELLEIKKQLISLNNYTNVIKDVDELLCDKYSEMELEQLKILKSKLIEMDLDTLDIDRYIKRKDEITQEIVDKMNKEDIEYLVYERELTLEELLMIKKVEKKVGLNEFDKDYVNDMINDYTYDFETEEEVKNAINLFKKYELSNSSITRKARKLNIDIIENEITLSKKELGNSVYGEILASEIDKYILDFPRE